jgi:hypothetical protein
MDISSSYEPEPGELPGSYLGSMSDSLRLLPRYYQVMCICSVSSLFWLDKAIVVALLNNFHINFGAKFVWAEDYTNLLSVLQLHERVALAAYAIGLAGVIAVVFSICALASRYSLSPLQHALFPARENLSIFLWTVFSANTFFAVLVNITPACSVVEVSQSSTAGRSESGVTALHAAIQAEILWRTGLWWFRRVLVPCAAGAAFRFLRDSWRHEQGQRSRSLRRYVLSSAWFRVLFRAVEIATSSMSVVAASSADLFELEVELLSAAVIFLVLSHECGSADPSGDIRGLSWKRQLMHGVASCLYCASAPAVLALLLIAGLVGVHVVELITVWFLFTLFTLWVPAVFDSFALDYLASLLAAVCAAIWSYELAPIDTAVRMWVAWFAAATAIATFINFASNLFRSRKLSLGIVLATGSAILYRQEQRLQFTSSIASAVVAMDSQALFGGFGVLSGSFSNSGASGNDLSLMSNLLVATVTTVFFTGCNEFLGWKRSSKSRSSIVARRRRKLPLVTFAVLAVKLSQVLIFGAFVFLSLSITVLLRDTLLPVFMSIFPRQMHRLVAPVLGCLVFGALMDSREDCLTHVLRALGLVDKNVDSDGTGDGEQD